MTESWCKLCGMKSRFEPILFEHLRKEHGVGIADVTVSDYIGSEQWNEEALQTLWEWHVSHLFHEIVEEYSDAVTVRVVCPLCRKSWGPRTWKYNRFTQTRISAWVGSTIAKHFMKEHGFNMEKIAGGLDNSPARYRCKCGRYIDGLTLAVAHWLNCKKGGFHEQRA